jgi:RNA polymerase sigma-70 factor (ECF subfamily)
VLTTSDSLLQRLRQPAPGPAWGRFVELYTPLLLYWTRRAGLEPTDAEDVVQDVFAVLVRELPAFQHDPSKSFRGWLRTIVVHKVRDRQRRAHPAATLDGDGPPVPDPLEALWDAEYRQFLVRQALAIMQAGFEATTWQAFYETAVHDRPAAAVAAELGVTPNAVYLARARVAQRLRTELAGLLE